MPLFQMNLSTLVMVVLMPRLRPLKTNFVAGEMSENMNLRPELQAFGNGARRLRNFEITPQGEINTRSGQRYLATIDDKDGGGYSDVRLAKFQFSTEQEYIFVFHDFKLTIFRNEVQVAQIATPYSSDDLRAKYNDDGSIIHTGISWASDLDTMIVFHQNHPMQKIVRQGDHASWEISEFVTKNIQKFRYSDGVYGNRYDTGVTVTAPYGAATNINNVLDDDKTSIAENIFPVGQLNENIQDNVLFMLDAGEIRKIGLIECLGLATNRTSSIFLQIIHSVDGVDWVRVGEAIEISAAGTSILGSAGTTIRGGQFRLNTDIEARYVGLAITELPSATAGLINNVNCHSFHIFDETTGVSEVQQINFTNATSTFKWTQDDALSFILLGEETRSFSYDDDPIVMRQRIEAALLTLASLAAGDIEVEFEGIGLTDDVDFVVTFTGNAANRPWDSIFVNAISTRFAVRSTVLQRIIGKFSGENVWSHARGYPRCGIFFQERLWVGGSRSLPNYIWATRSQTIDDFNSEKDDADFGMAVPVDASDVPLVLYFEVGRHLQIFATSGEFYVPISEAQGITPQNITIRSTNTKGSQAGLRVYDVDGATIFVQRLGRTIRRLLFTDAEIAYDAENISLMASDIIRNPVAVALRRASSTRDANQFLMCNEDGTLTQLTTLRNENVNGFALWSTKGIYHDVETLLDTLYFAVIREVDGVQKMMLEIQDDALVTDCAVVQNDLSAPVSSQAIAHLGSREVSIVLDGLNQQDQNIEAGSVTFERDAETSIEVGLKWPVVLPDEYPDLIYVAATLPVEAQLQDGATHGRKKRIVDIAVRLRNTTSLIMNGSELSFRKIGDGLLDQPIQPFTGLHRERGILGFSYDAIVVLGDSVPSKATIMGLSYGVQV